MSQPPSQPKPPVQYVFDRQDETVIAFNQSGELTPEQRQGVLIKTLETGCIITPLIFVLGSCVGFSLFIPLIDLLDDNNILSPIGLILLGVIGLIAIGTLFFTLRSGLRGLGFWRDLGDPKVEDEQGEIRWAGNGYEAVVGRHKLDLSQGFFTRIPQRYLPGNYRFFFLKQSRWLLSMVAERSENERKGTLQGLLNQILGFENASDLIENRNGRLSVAQAQHLQQRVMLTLIGIGILAGLTFLAGLGYLFSPGSDLEVGIVSMVALQLVFFGVIFMVFINPQRDIRQGTVTSVEGLIERRTQRRGKQTIYSLWIDREKFTIDFELYQAIPDGLDGRVYYTPTGRKIVGIEILNED